jgi:hypothetical protein
MDFGIFEKIQKGGVLVYNAEIEFFFSAINPIECNGISNLARF